MNGTFAELARHSTLRDQSGHNNKCFRLRFVCYVIQCKTCGYFNLQRPFNYARYKAITLFSSVLFHYALLLFSLQQLYVNPWSTSLKKNLESGTNAVGKKAQNLIIIRSQFLNGILPLSDISLKAVFSQLDFRKSSEWVKLFWLTIGSGAKS